eukprot:scaffold4.g4936.t1
MLQAIQRAQAGIVARAAWGQAALQTNRWFTGSCAVQSDQPSAAPKVPRVPPGLVDLDTELDRDDPLLADKSHLWDTPKPPPYVDLETEMDLMDDPTDVPVRKGARKA